MFKVELSDMPETMNCGQLQRIKVFMVNKSDSIPVGNIRIASNGISSGNFCFATTNVQKDLDNDLLGTIKKTELKSKEISNSEPEEESSHDPNKLSFQHRQNQATNPSLDKEIDSGFIFNLDGVTIGPSDHYELDLWIKAPDIDGEHAFYLMFFYDDASNLKSDSKSHKGSFNPLSLK